MTTFTEGPPPSDGDDTLTTARLLQLAGAREDGDPDGELRVRQVVLAECYAVARRRRLVRRGVIAVAGLSMAAAAVLAVRLWNPSEPTVPATSEIVATVHRLEGGARIFAASEPWGAGRDLAVQASIHSGDSVHTPAGGRLALRLANGTSVRFDAASRARLLTAEAIELNEGGIYVDNPMGGNGIAIRTPWGDVRDIGTQFEVRVGPTSLRVRVRSGRVALRSGGQETPGQPGTELTVEGGRVVSREVAVHGPEWAWTTNVAPAIPMEGRPLSAVLDDLCRELGWTLRYAEPGLRREASAEILSGSLDGLSPEEALKTVFEVSALGLAHRVQNGEVVVSRATRTR